MHTHSDRLERWLGRAQVAGITNAMRDFYWPVAVHGVPGNVRAMPGGDFCGEIRAGAHASAHDRAADALRRVRRNRFARAAMSRKQLGAFTSLSALINAATTAGKAQYFSFNKTGVATNAIGQSNDLWTRAGTPVAGGAGSAAPGGVAPSSATGGAWTFTNPGVANTTHFVSGGVTSSVINNTLLLYDRLFAVVKTMNSTATEAVSGAVGRYTSTTASAVNYAGGNFCFPANPTTVLAATGHNWTVCQYTDQGGTTASSFASGTGVSACVVGGVDLATGWFLNLASGDTGVQALTQMQCSALVATGTIDFVVGHPIAFFPCPVANQICILDGLYTAFNLTPILDNAALTFLEINKPATTAANYAGIVNVVAE